MNYTYMLLCGDGSFYVGWTNDLEKRVKAHEEGIGGKYTRSHRPVKLVYYETFSEAHDARSREWHLKRLSHEEKDRLAAAFSAEKRLSADSPSENENRS